MTWRIARLLALLAGLMARNLAVGAWHEIRAAVLAIPPKWTRRILWAALFAAWPVTGYLRYHHLLPGGFLAATVESWAAGAPVAWALLAFRKRQQREWVDSRGRLGAEPGRVAGRKGRRHGVVSPFMTYQRGPLAEELSRRAQRIREGMPERAGSAVARQVDANAEAIDRIETEVAAIKDGLIAAFAAAGEPVPEVLGERDRPDLRLIQGGAA